MSTQPDTVKPSVVGSYQEYVFCSMFGVPSVHTESWQLRVQYPGLSRKMKTTQESDQLP